MFIQFNKLTIKNFMSVGNNPVVVNLDKTNKTLIKGFNGNGKSVILHALTYALFGRAYAKINLTSLVNSINAKECVVELEFTIGTTSYKIIRGMKPKKFEIYIDNVLLKQDALNKDYQLHLEDYIIKMNFNTYCQLMALGSMSYVPFLQLKAQERRAFVEFILNIEIFSGMNKQLRDQITLNKNTLFESNLAIDSIKTIISNIQQVIDWANNDNTNKIQDIDNKIQLRLEEYKAQESVITNLKESLQFIIVDDTIINNAKINVEKCNRILTTKEIEAEEVRKKINFLKKNDMCTVCGQVVNDEHKSSHITEYNVELTNLGEIILKVKTKLEEFTVELDSLHSKMREKTQLENKIKIEESKFTSIKQDIRTLHAEKTKLESNSSNNLIVDKQRELDENKIKLDEFTKKYDTALTTKRVLDIMAIDLKDNGAKADIIKTYIPIINALVNKYLQKMNLFVKFELDENFNETLKSRHRDEFSYESFSMGERMRVSLALLFAWRELTKIRTGVSSNVLFFDEILEILDEDGFNVLLTMISEEQNTNCFVISHKTGLDAMFDDIMTVRKVKGFTQVQIET